MPLRFKEFLCDSQNKKNSSI